MTEVAADCTRLFTSCGATAGRRGHRKVDVGAGGDLQIISARYGYDLRIAQIVTHPPSPTSLPTGAAMEWNNHGNKKTSHAEIFEDKDYKYRRKLLQHATGSIGSLDPKENCTFIATRIGLAYLEGDRRKDAEALRVVEINPTSRRPPECISQLVTDIRTKPREEMD
ncbi:hypothetical protein B0H13DRAFT_1857087 [Mycena leptocephala]|nr:hypothetical protein B0H13DRAFT_1867997 [Mycena leptocephala]KAJ7932249.1 hypothetical protein B0H13DRAFT_1857087 [Mycena leptocephala]